MPVYSDTVFRVGSLEDAKRIILTPERELTTEERWVKETPYLLSQMQAWFPRDKSILLDYGCGLGRLSKAWLDEAASSVVLGADISPDMRNLASQYVANPRFSAVSPELLSSLLSNGLRFDGVVASWIIQHCLNAQETIDLLIGSLKPGGRLFVVNTLRRAVPTDQGWVDDGFDVQAELTRRLKILLLGRLPETATSQHIAENTFMGVFEA